jgi:hypothetical protein
MVGGRENVRNSSTGTEIVSVEYQSHAGVIEIFPKIHQIDLRLNMSENDI